MSKTKPWNHNIHYHDALLHSVPNGCSTALDVGCGTGLLACRLSERCESVVALDSVRGAFACEASNVRFIADDVLLCALPDGGFDCVTAVAMLHHMPLDAGLLRLRELVRPGGVLLILGLYRRSGWADYVWDAVALPVSRVLRLLHGGMTDVSAAVKVPESTLPEIKAAAEALLPGAVIQRRLLFRYVLRWQRSHVR